MSTPGDQRLARIGALAATGRAARAAELMASHGPGLQRVARRVCGNDADAEDAVQRAAEILLRKGPDLEPRRLLAWTRVVVRREALAIVRERSRTPVETAQRTGLSEFDPDQLLSCLAEPAARLDARERTARASERLSSLKPQERRAIALQAAGCSYAEIQAITGWTYTKVNRCLAEGRAALRASRAPAAAS